MMKIIFYVKRKTFYKEHLEFSKTMNNFFAKTFIKKGWINLKYSILNKTVLGVWDNGEKEIGINLPNIYNTPILSSTFEGFVNELSKVIEHETLHYMLHKFKVKNTKIHHKLIYLIQK